LKKHKNNGSVRRLWNHSKSKLDKTRS